MNRSILAVPGLASTTPEFRAALWNMAARNGWDVDAIATVISSESRFQPAAKNPYATATGLIQFIESTANSLGTTTAALRTMSAEEQLPYVEKFYKRAGLTKDSRGFDFYVVGTGKRPGLALGTQVVSDEAYDINKGLDRDGDGKITVWDIKLLFDHIQGLAKGARLDASEVSSPLGGSSVSPQLQVQSLQSLARGVVEAKDTANTREERVFLQAAVNVLTGQPTLVLDGFIGPNSNRALEKVKTNA